MNFSSKLIGGIGGKLGLEPANADEEEDENKNA
jgi:hypothetical protein